MDWRLRMGKSVRKVMYGGRAGVHRWSKIHFIGGTQNLVLHRNKQSSRARLRRDAVSVLCHK